MQSGLAGGLLIKKNLSCGSRVLRSFVVIPNNELACSLTGTHKERKMVHCVDRYCRVVKKEVSS